jgi:hypothetical protein
MGEIDVSSVTSGRLSLQRQRRGPRTWGTQARAPRADMHLLLPLVRSIVNIDVRFHDGVLH